MEWIMGELGCPLFSFAVITDVQYADVPDGFSYHGVPRFYRRSLEALGEAVRSWNSRGGLAFGIHFGDLVDGVCPKEESKRAFDKVLSLFRSFQGGPFYHIIGNHCLYNLSRTDLNGILGIPASPDGRSYYEFSPLDWFRCIVLDGYDISALGWPVDHPHTLLGKGVLAARNPNGNKDSPRGLHGTSKRFVKFNGGIGSDQLCWLRNALEEATRFKQLVIICCHIPLHPGPTHLTALLWNYEEVLAVLHSYKCVVAGIYGHNHTGGHAVDSHGIHHIVLEAVLECPPGSNSFGHIDVYPDRLSLVGNSRMSSREMPFRFRSCIPEYVRPKAKAGSGRPDNSRASSSSCQR